MFPVGSLVTSQLCVSQIVFLTTKHRIRNALGFSWWWRLRQLLAPRRRRNHFISGTIGDALECVRDAGQLKCNLLRSARPFQHDDAFSTEIKSGPEHQANYEGYAGHEHVVACYGDASARDTNQVV